MMKKKQQMLTRNVFELIALTTTSSEAEIRNWYVLHDKHVGCKHTDSK